jgi:protein SCO1
VNPSPPTRARNACTLLARALAALACACVGVDASSASPVQQFKRITTDVGLDPRLDQEIPRDLPFVDESGKAVRLGDYFAGDKPVVLILVYFGCPMLCTEVLNGFERCLKTLDLDPGEDFEIVTVSIDPREKPELAAEKKAHYIEKLGRPEAAAGWHFLTTSDDATIHRLADSIGYRYFYDDEIKEYAHPGVLTILTPAAKVSHYISDVEFVRSLKFALIDASAGEIGSWTDHLLLRCYHYDPVTGKYGFAITGVIRSLGVLTVLVLACFIVVTLRRDRRMQRAPVMT